MGIHGIPIELAVKTQTGTDSFNRPIYETSWETVNNVLVGQPTTEEITDELNLSGKRLDYLRHTKGRYTRLGRHSGAFLGAGISDHRCAHAGHR